MAELIVSPAQTPSHVRRESVSPGPARFPGLSVITQSSRTDLSHFFISSSYSYSDGTSSAHPSILYRQNFSRPTQFSPAQAWMDGWVTRVTSTMSRPESLALWVGGNYLFSTARTALQLEQFSIGSALRALPELPSVSSFASSRWRFALPALGAAAVGCSGGGGNGQEDGGGGYDAQLDASPDGGVRPIDQDGDGYPGNAGAVPDCDDTNASIHPLPPGGGLVHVNSSLVVCPGTYHGARILIDPGTNGINLIGTGVTMNGDGMMEPAIRMNQVSLVNVRGFNISNYPLGAATIHLTNADNNRFEDMTVEAPLNRYAFYIDNSDNNTLERVTINSHSDSGVYAANSSTALTVRQCTIQGIPPFDAVPAYGLLTIDGGSSHLIEDNIFRAGSRYGLELYNMTNATVRNNQVLNNLSDGIYCSNMTTTLLQGNIVNGNSGYGLNLRNGSTMNSIMGNNFTMNTLGALTTDASSSSGNTFSGNTPPP